MSESQSTAPKPSLGSRARSAFAWWLFSTVMFWMVPFGLLVGVVTAPFDPRRDWLRVFVGRWSSLYAHATPLYRFRVEGRERLPRGVPYVLVANHESGLDILCLMRLYTPARFLAEDWILSAPLAGRVLQACRHIPVVVGDKESGRRALETCGEALAEGSPVAAFPEGRIAPRGMERFRPGAFVAAQRAGVPVVPVLLDGTARAWKPGSWVVQGRHRIRIAVLEPIDADTVKAADPEELAAHVRQLLLDEQTPADQPIP